MKVQIEMDLADLLRISVLLDHHRAQATERSSAGQDSSATERLFAAWGTEAGELNKKLLGAVARRQKP